MNPAQWATIRELFAKARELPKEDKESFVLEKCATTMPKILH